MINLDEGQKKEYRALKYSLLNSTSNKEINYYEAKIHKLLDRTQVKVENESRLTEEQKLLYREYKEKLFEASSTEDIRYYRDAILDLLD